MQWFVNAFVAVRDFMELGGPVLTLIGWVIFLMWAMIVERMIFFQTVLKKTRAEICSSWEGRKERRSWYAHQIREGLISRYSMSKPVIG